MKAALFLHRPSPPFTPIRELMTATDVDRVRPLDRPGQLSFRVSIEEANLLGVFWDEQQLDENPSFEDTSRVADASGISVVSGVGSSAPSTTYAYQGIWSYRFVQAPGLLRWFKHRSDGSRWPVVAGRSYCHRIAVRMDPGQSALLHNDLYWYDQAGLPIPGDFTNASIVDSWAIMTHFSRAPAGAVSAHLGFDSLAGWGAGDVLYVDAQNFIEGSVRCGGPLKEGALIVDRSTEGIEPWLWYVRRLSVDVESGYIDVECAEWRQLLYERLVPLGQRAASRSPSTEALQLLAASGGRNPTHIYARSSKVSPALRHALPTTPLQLGGLSLGDAFDQLAAVSNSEWWVDYPISSRSVAPRLRWQMRRGRDLRHAIHIQEGYDIVAATYSLDASDASRTVRVVQGGSASPATTATAAVALDTGALVKDRTASPGRFAAAPTLERRAFEDAGRGAPLHGERLAVLPQQADEGSLQVAALANQELPVTALQSLDLVIRPPKLEQAGTSTQPSVRSVWGLVDLGDVILIRLNVSDSILDLSVRIIAIQPDEGSGELSLAVEVQR